MASEQELLVNRLRIGTLLTMIRDRRGMSQKELSTELGYNNATFTCAVEKGKSSIPMERLLDWATLYMPDDKYMLASGIMRSVHPDAWQVAVNILGNIIASNDRPEKVDKKVQQWLEKKYAEYGVTI